MKIVHGKIEMIFEPQDQSLAEDLLQFAESTLTELHKRFDLKLPASVKLVILTSWPTFPFRTAPWYLQPLVVLTFPFWALRTRRIWPMAGGWQQSYPGGVAAVGIKPPRLIEAADRSLGEEIFRAIEDPLVKQHSILAHEMTHACTDDLRLPVWLHEGLAMAMSDHVLNVQTVLPRSRRLIRAQDLTPEKLKMAYRGRDREGLLALYAAGYWLVRWLEEAQPSVLKDLLGQRMPHLEVESRVASALGCQPEQIWNCLEAMAADEFSGFVKLDVGTEQS